MPDFNKVDQPLPAVYRSSLNKNNRKALVIEQKPSQYAPSLFMKTGLDYAVNN